ncbi:flippase-like domain-containing protein [Actinomarinicola tropica]|uniref:Flippase-like domain-containing protein n=2 Tax=Actinomarinicola tropica TaxID=2789776 RepID=A0A5Q2RFM7_9ACTN|nr:flippase-like domain-containing protein [Actinomarinicola tropica]
MSATTASRPRAVSNNSSGAGDGVGVAGGARRHGSRREAGDCRAGPVASSRMEPATPRPPGDDVDAGIPRVEELESPSALRTTVWRAVLIALAGLSLYVFAPSLVEVYSSWDTLVHLQPWWLIAIFGFQVASFAGIWTLQHIALRATSWFPVITSQLAGNAFSRVVPGGAAAGVALQMRMLTKAGVNTTTAASSLTAVSLLTTGTVFALPVLALPAMIAGTPVRGPLLTAVLLGFVVFVLLAVVGTWLMRSDPPLLAVGRAVQATRNRLTSREPIADLPHRLVEERNIVRRTLGARKRDAILATIGRSLFDYLSLLAALAAVGANPNPSLVLLAFVTALVLGMIPITPGGLGFVEAGLTATLSLAGIGAPEAILATGAYRLASFWLPLPAGLVAWILFRVRVGRPVDA